MLTAKKNVKDFLIKFPALYELALRLFGKSTANEIRVFRKVICDGDMVFDVGSNIGQFVPLFSRLVGRTGSVHAFEPVSAMFNQLSANVKQCRLPSKIFLNNCAVSSSNGTTKIYVPGSDYTQASMAKHSVHSWSESKEDASQSVDTITLDSYIGKCGAKKVSFIKCDVEGAELLVLKGAESILKSENPPVLFLEICEQWIRDFNYEPRELLAFLENEAGYKIVYLGRKGLAYVSSKAEKIGGEFPDYLNYLCFIPAKHGERVADLLKCCRENIA